MVNFLTFNIKSIFSSLESYISSWLYHHYHAFGGNWCTDYLVWVLEIWKKKKRFPISGFSLSGLRNFHALIFVVEITKKLHGTCFLVGNIPDFLMWINQWNPGTKAVRKYPLTMPWTHCLQIFLRSMSVALVPLSGTFFSYVLHGLFLHFT